MDYGAINEVIIFSELNSNIIAISLYEKAVTKPK